MFPSNFPGLGESAQNKRGFGFDTIDLEVANDFYVNNWVSARPFIGIKAAQINQNSSTVYGGVTLTNTDDKGNIVSVLPVAPSAKKKK